MRNTVIGLLLAGVVVTAGFAPAPKIFAQQPACLHQAGESADQQMRRRQALTYARQINTVENAVRSQAGAYQPLGGLQRVSPVAPPGFAVHLAADTNGYAFSIKDSTDPCGFAYFSDQDGTIYAGEVIR